VIVVSGELSIVSVFDALVVEPEELGEDEPHAATPVATRPATASPTSPRELKR
jgi:hypothetical protein